MRTRRAAAAVTAVLLLAACSQEVRGSPRRGRRPPPPPRPPTRGVESEPEPEPDATAGSVVARLPASAATAPRGGWSWTSGRRGPRVDARVVGGDRPGRPAGRRRRRRRPRLRVRSADPDPGQGSSRASVSQGPIAETLTVGGADGYEEVLIGVRGGEQPFSAEARTDPGRIVVVFPADPPPVCRTAPAGRAVPCASSSPAPTEDRPPPRPTAVRPRRHRHRHRPQPRSRGRRAGGRDASGGPRTSSRPRSRRWRRR
jgi:hypothetical protein